MTKVTIRPILNGTSPVFRTSVQFSPGESSGPENVSFSVSKQRNNENLSDNLTYFTNLRLHGYMYLRKCRSKIQIPGVNMQSINDIQVFQDFRDKNLGLVFSRKSLSIFCADLLQMH